MIPKPKYIIEENDVFGRYMVADADIKEGETILSESPILLGSQVGGPLRCFNCYKKITKESLVVCKFCDGALLCNPACRGRFHNSEECRALQESNFKGSLIQNNEQIIFPIRCLLLRKYNPKEWKNIMNLEHHCKEREGTAIWRINAAGVEAVIREASFVSEHDVSDDLMQKICGILDVNTFEVRPPYQESLSIQNPEVECLRGLYINAALMAHDCTGNTFLAVDDEFILTVKACVDITKNTPIYFNYANSLSGSNERREHLREGKYFDCTCSRCKDPTELGTHLSSLKCHSCRKGYVLPKNPECNKSDWFCSDCGKMYLNTLIKMTIGEARRRILEIGHFDVSELQMLLDKYQHTFHPNHYILLEMKQALIGLYARMPPTVRNLSTKIKLCEEIFDVVSKIEPGISRIKAMTLYQLQSAQIDLAHKMHNNGELKLDELIIKLRNAESNLKESVRYLLYEPVRSPEGKIAQMAMSELKMLRISIENILTNSFQECEKSSVNKAQKKSIDRKSRKNKIS